MDSAKRLNQNKNLESMDISKQGLDLWEVEAHQKVMAKVDEFIAWKKVFSIYRETGILSFQPLRGTRS